MDRQLLREALAYFASGLVHVGIFGTLAVVGNSDPVPWATRQGRASPALSASMAASPKAQELVELDLPISIELSRPAPGKVDVTRITSLPERQLPKLDIGPRLELPTPHGTRLAVAPASGKSKEKEAAQEQRTKAVAESPKPASRPPKVLPDARLAAVASQASVASVAMSGTETDVLPSKAPTNPEPIYPPGAERAGQQGVVKLRVTVAVDGTVAALRLEKSSGFPLLDNSALATVRYWRFTPGRRGGSSVSMDVIVPIRFTNPPRT